MSHSEKKNLATDSRLRIAAGAVVTLVVVLAGTLMLMGKKRPADEELGLTYTVRSEPFKVSISESGSIESRNREVIKSQVEGRQTIIYLIDEGTQVEEGDLLIEFDVSELQDRLTEEEIELKNAEAELVSARENLAVVRNQAEADIAQAELDSEFAQQDLKNYREGEYEMALKSATSKITLAQAELQQAKDRLEGSQRLYDKRYISATELESDRLALQRAQMDLELAQEEKRILETYTYARRIAQLNSDVEQTGLALERAQRRASADIAQAEARLSAREAEVQRERISTAELSRNIENCRITAPTSGMVVYAPQGGRWDRETLEEGSEVRERQELLYLPTAAQMSARINVHETMLSKLEIGQEATIRVDALPNTVLTGNITEIAVMP
ncbi:MAG: HlyD family secretion protein, partial [Opitutales bacterium]